MSEVREPIKKSSILKKEKIIEKGFELMCEKGYHNVSSVDIAKYTGVSTGCIYQYFPDKKAIFIEGAKIYLKQICFPLLDVFEEYCRTAMSMKELIQKVLDKSVQSQKLSYHAHQELMSMCCLDKEVAEIFNQNELEVTERILFLLSGHHSKEKIHLFVQIVDDYSHEVIYHKHPEYDYKIMYEETRKILLNLLKGETPDET